MSFLNQKFIKKMSKAYPYKHKNKSIKANKKG